MKIKGFWPIQWSTDQTESCLTMKMVSNVPNIHLGIYKHYQNFHPLIFYRHTRLRRLGAYLSRPGWNRVKHVVGIFIKLWVSTNAKRLPVVSCRGQYKPNKNLGNELFRATPFSSHVWSGQGEQNNGRFNYVTWLNESLTFICVVYHKIQVNIHYTYWLFLTLTTFGMVW